MSKKSLYSYDEGKIDDEEFQLGSTYTRGAHLKKILKQVEYESARRMNICFG